MNVTSNEKRRRLRALLTQPGLSVAPSCGDALTARLVESCGYPAVHCSGSVVHNTAGFADGGLLTLTEFVATLTTMSDAVSIPLIADADTGYGSAANVVRTVREYERAGVAALHMEDQVTPTRPARGAGYTVRTISRDEMTGKVRAALDARQDGDLVIIVRCDFKGERQEVIDRLGAYLEAGADAAWFPSGTDEEMSQARKALKKPLIGVLQPAMTLKQFEELGASIAMLPGTLQVAALHAQKRVLEELKRSGSLKACFDGLEGIEEIKKFYANQGAEELLGMDRKYG